MSDETVNEPAYLGANLALIFSAADDNYLFSQN